MLLGKGHNGFGSDIENALASEVVAQGSMDECAVMSEVFAMQSMSAMPLQAKRAMAVMSEGMAMQCSLPNSFMY